MRYMLLIYGNENAMGSAPPEAVTKMSAAYSIYTQAMKDAGVLLGKTGPGRNVLTFLPPLVVTREDLDDAVDRLDQTLRSAEVK